LNVPFVEIESYNESNIQQPLVGTINELRYLSHCAIIRLLWQVRAFAEWPGAKAKFDIRSADGLMKSLDLKIITTRVGGEVVDSNDVVKLVGDALVVPCGDNVTLEILELQPPGKKVMRAKDFCNGLRGQQILVSKTKQLSV